MNGCAEAEYPPGKGCKLLLSALMALQTPTILRKRVAEEKRMLALHRKRADASIPADKKLYQRQIDAMDRQIDRLVYELYGLTEEEIGIVEEGV